MRYLPVFAWFFTLAALIFSLTALLVGVEPGSANSAPLATYNVSYLGLNEYRHPNSLLGPEVLALIPANSNISGYSPSITQYLGIKDWYTIHYLSICSGFYVPSESNPSLLTTSSVNVTCTRQRSGYTFWIADILRAGLKPSVQSLVEIDHFTIDTRSYNTAPWVNLWYAGIVFAFLEFFLLPFTFSGKRRLNMWAFIATLISFLMFDISSGLVTGHVIGMHRHGLATYPAAFLGLTWTSCVCMILVLFLTQMEWKCQVWTPVGEQIRVYWKPRGASWYALRPPGSKKIKEFWDVRYGL